MKAISKVAVGVIAAGLVAVAGGSPASAATRNGYCDPGEVCFYYFSDRGGSLSDFSSSVANYGSTQPSCYEFRTGGKAGYERCMKNNVMSVWNRSGRTVRVYYNSNYGGAAQDIPAGSVRNLNSTLRNNNASHRFL